MSSTIRRAGAAYVHTVRGQKVATFKHKADAVAHHNAMKLVLDAQARGIRPKGK